MNHALLYAMFTMSFVVGLAALMFLLHPRIRNEVGVATYTWRLLFVGAVAFLLIGVIGWVLTSHYESQQFSAGSLLAFLLIYEYSASHI